MTICRPGPRLTNHDRRDFMRGSVLTFMNDERKSYFDLPFEAFINYYCKHVRSYHEQKILFWWIPLLRLQNQGAGWCFNCLLFRSSRMKVTNADQSRFLNYYDFVVRLKSKDLDSYSPVNGKYFLVGNNQLFCTLFFFPFISHSTLIFRLPQAASHAHMLFQQ